MQIHIHSDGQQQGPFTVETINRAIQNGTVSTPSTLAWYDGCSDWIPLTNVPGVRSALVPLPPPPPPAPQPQGDSTGGLIPYKNPHALIAYYLGFVSLLPAIGFLLAIPTLLLGISGLRKRRQNPIIKGSIHAWIGISLASSSIFCHVVVAFLFFLGWR